MIVWNQLGKALDFEVCGHRFLVAPWGDADMTEKEYATAQRRGVPLAELQVPAATRTKHRAEQLREGDSAGQVSKMQTEAKQATRAAEEARRVAEEAVTGKRMAETELAKATQRVEALEARLKEKQGEIDGLTEIASNARKNAEGELANEKRELIRLLKSAEAERDQLKAVSGSSADAQREIAKVATELQAAKDLLEEKQAEIDGLMQIASDAKARAENEVAAEKQELVRLLKSAEAERDQLRLASESTAGAQREVEKLTADLQAAKALLDEKQAEIDGLMELAGDARANAESGSAQQIADLKLQLKSAEAERDQAIKALQDAAPRDESDEVGALQRELASKTEEVEALTQQVEQVRADITKEHEDLELQLMAEVEELKSALQKAGAPAAKSKSSKKTAASA